MKWINPADELRILASYAAFGFVLGAADPAFRWLAGATLQNERIGTWINIGILLPAAAIALAVRFPRTRTILLGTAALAALATVAMLAFNGLFVPQLSTKWLVVGVLSVMEIASPFYLVAAAVAGAVARRWRRVGECPMGECPECGYALHGLGEPRCPECGTPFDPCRLQATSTDAPLYG